MDQRQSPGTTTFCYLAGKTHHIPVDEFYTLKRAERGNLVKEQLAEEKNIPQYLRSHWQKETGLPFLPVTRCLLPVGLLAVGLLWRVGER